MNTGLGSVTTFALLVGLLSLFQGNGFGSALMLAGICFFFGLVWKLMTGTAGSGLLSGLLMIFGLGWLIGSNGDDDGEE
ncbi:MAG: hypothetical protein HOM11_02465 [Methylococcales bacterium]|jgi:hypothetical protein|nr:hypothetical protein [Methylococcales bacterium]MBT7443692.1 hypothetical protein [Methylococcales bacterium]